MKKLILLSSLVFIAIIAWALSPAAVRPPADYTVHEWGTFTSVQGGDGKLLEWRPLLTSELPGFVHSLTQPGLGRLPARIGKGGLLTLQRMETPVIYFYSKTNLAVDVSVHFPKGVITEWYPQANQVGESMELNSFSPANGLAAWDNLQIAPSLEKLPYAGLSLSQDTSGSHYFAARSPAADYVAMNLPGLAAAPAEAEKFIFYRGAGSFETPLHVDVDDSDDVAVANSGPQKLSHLLLVSIHHGQGAFAVMDGLPCGGPVCWRDLTAPDDENWRHLPLPQFQAAVGIQMESALVAEGLFPGEAKAMVNTWKDSWFTEDGERILYILPRAWTDEILPLAISPQPKALVRVMVGRAEIITPAAITQLLEDVALAQGGDMASHQRAVADWKSLGRFAPPAFKLLMARGDSTNVLSGCAQFFSEAMEARN